MFNYLSHNNFPLLPIIVILANRRKVKFNTKPSVNFLQNGYSKFCSCKFFTNPSQCNSISSHDFCSFHDKMNVSSFFRIHFVIVCARLYGVCTYVCVHACTGACACGGQRSTPGIALRFSFESGPLSAPAHGACPLDRRT